MVARGAGRLARLGAPTRAPRAEIVSSEPIAPPSKAAVRSPKRAVPRATALAAGIASVTVTATGFE